jgi:hypothetical protein
MAYFSESSQSQSCVTADGWSASLFWCQAPIWGQRPDIYYCLLRACWCGAPSLTKGRVCRWQLLLALASGAILGSESHGSHDHILLSQIRDPPNQVGQAPVFVPPRTGWPSYTLRHLVPFSSPPTTRRTPIWVPEISLMGVKLQGREADHSSLSSSEINNGGAIPPFPHVFMA